MVKLLFIIILINFSPKTVFGRYNEKNFMSYAGRRISQTSDVEYLINVSEIQCMYSCLSSEKCCAVSYIPNINTCLIDIADMCCPAPENDSNWNIWINSRYLEGQHSAITSKSNIPPDVHRSAVNNINMTSSNAIRRPCKSTFSKTYCGEHRMGTLTVQRPIDCGDISGETGVYSIYGACPEYGFDVLCDMDTDGGGWTVFQKRMNGEIDFYRGWSEYENGFGDLRKEFWMGNKHLNEMTSQQSYVLRVDLEDFDNRTRYAQYGTFFVGHSDDKYKITVGDYSGDAGDSLAFSNGMSFTTKDQDNGIVSFNCALQFKGGWWYKDCHYANLNGLYLGGPHASFADGIEWLTFTGHFYSLKSVKMMIRRQ